MSNWKFDYFETSCWKYKDEKSKNHGIYNNDQTAKCDCSTSYCCYSLYRISPEMSPNSGIYDIELKIDDINDHDPWSAIGITANTDKN